MRKAARKAGEIVSEEEGEEKIWNSIFPIVSAKVRTTTSVQYFNCII